MSEPIKVGDLVMVVRGHKCLLEKWGGVPFTVSALVSPRGGGWKCLHCGKYNAGPDEVGAAGLIDDLSSAVPISFLLKIDPPADAVSEDARKPMKEPA